jgi:hypothetical protein
MIGCRKFPYCGQIGRDFHGTGVLAGLDIASRFLGERHARPLAHAL